MSEIKELFRLRTAVASEAVKNPDFLAALKSDPKKAITEFTGVDFDKVKINVVEEDGDTLTLPIPKMSEDLSSDQLEAVAGGAFFAAATAGTVAACAGAVGGTAAAAGGTYKVGKSSGWW